MSPHDDTGSAISLSGPVKSDREKRITEPLHGLKSASLI